MMLFKLLVVIILVYLIVAEKEISVNEPFHMRARLYNSYSASVQFEIDQSYLHFRNCQQYQFTITRNRELTHYMPAQNFTFWRNSVELIHLAVGFYNVCAIVCSEQFVNNDSIVTINCLTFRSQRSYFLFLTLYLLVFMILAFSQFVFTLKKRKFKAHVKAALSDLELALQRLRTPSMEPNENLTIQNLLLIPTQSHIMTDESNVILFNQPSEQQLKNENELHHTTIGQLLLNIERLRTPIEGNNTLLEERDKKLDVIDESDY
ncbi:unnamed protein product [Didymodactylos carnosus]|uniref:Uncharacterized protein n=1 Tax=Didymodactylos carnosus TaxID=1234261 RepID=A0A815FH44_9BILA|nr:unnamed protein product [Didymodactylos carnosus]CAF1326599.1 unnamed protein product [Didymodactylos carnosus]CAF3706500.1 unnamed protein product [Didymodactylos carnosus]CAF4176781.1 unnamed protein product [Didymodactylos carnosus]